MSDDWLSGGLFGLDTGLQVHSSQAANSTNVKIMRENNAFMERMSNSALQRRADDAEKAGFNRLLAATGPGASTPNAQGATVEPTYKGGAIMTAAQLKNMEANTELTNAEARIKKVEANTAEHYGEKLGLYNANIRFENSEQENIETARKRIEKDMTAAQLKHFKEMAPEWEQLAKQQAREGEINLKALTNIDAIGGVTGSRVTQWFKMLYDMYRSANPVKAR